MILRAPALLVSALLAAACAVGCDEDCSSLDDCDGEECQVIRGWKLGGTESLVSIPVGCAPAGRPAGDLQTYARAPDGACWMFTSTLIPSDFTPDRGCQQ